jgi:hypothetical protein
VAIPAAKKKRPASELDAADEAATWFLAALGLSDEERLEIYDRAARQAAGVATYSQAQLIQQVWEAADTARSTGVELEEFKTQIASALAAAWGDAEAWRIALMASLVTQTPYQLGRWTAMTEPERVQGSPMWAYTSALESNTCSYCRELHGTTLSAAAPWWFDHFPPQHGNCLCSVVEAEEGAVATADPPDPDPKSEGFGGPPQEWEPDWSEFPAPIAAAARTKR